MYKHTAQPFYKRNFHCNRNRDRQSANLSNSSFNCAWQPIRAVAAFPATSCPDSEGLSVITGTIWRSLLHRLRPSGFASRPPAPAPHKSWSPPCLRDAALPGAVAVNVSALCSLLCHQWSLHAAQSTRSVTTVAATHVGACCRSSVPSRTLRCAGCRKTQIYVTNIHYLPALLHSLPADAMLTPTTSAVFLPCAQAQVQRFEVFAGRSAMLGFAAAFAAELLTEESLFSGLLSATSDRVAYAAALAAALAVAAAAAAAASKQREGARDLEEVVITSLTASARSAASVNGGRVDSAVDAILASMFDLSTLYSIMADEELLI